jgi:hypothetical protein
VGEFRARTPSVLRVRDPDILHSHPWAGILEDGLDPGKLRRILLTERGRARMEEVGRRRCVAINPAPLDERE